MGLDHEYLLSRDGEGLDFRDVIHGLPIPGYRLDPGDANAYRCASGLALTCDDREAEVASPPLPLAPHFTRRIDGWAHAGRTLLGDLLPVGVVVEGFSTPQRRGAGPSRRRRARPPGQDLRPVADDGAGRGGLARCVPPAPS